MRITSPTLKLHEMKKSTNRLNRAAASMYKWIKCNPHSENQGWFGARSFWPVTLSS